MYVPLGGEIIPQNLTVVSGTGIYDGASGLETIRQSELGVIGVFDLSLLIVT